MGEVMSWTGSVETRGTDNRGKDKEDSHRPMSWTGSVETKGTDDRGKDKEDPHRPTEQSEEGARGDKRGLSRGAPQRRSRVAN